MAQTTLHHQLKAFYAGPSGRTEVVLDGFRIDAVRRGRLYEIQTGSFGALRDKLRSLAERRRVVLVFPIAAVKHIERLDRPGGSVLGRRKSPRRGTFLDAFVELVSLAEVLPHPRIELELVLTEETDVRVDDGRGSRRRRGVSLVDRRLERIVERRRLRDAADYLALLPRLPDRSPFTTADLAACMGKPRWLAQKAAYFLRRGGALSVVSRGSGGFCYRVPPIIGKTRTSA